MYKVKLLSKVLLIFMLSTTGNVSAQTKDSEILTLFTTQQERELIDRNRYKKKQVKNTVVKAEKPPQQNEIEVETEEIKLTLKLDGVAISKSGQNIAWVNGKPYEHGEKLEDGSKVYINANKTTQIQIKTPDGKYHSIVTGETIDISYYRRIGG